MKPPAPSLRCPDDAQPLRVLTDGPVPFATCGQCAGLWFEWPAIERAHSAAAAIPSESRRVQAAPRPRANPRQCPECRSPLQAIVAEGIEIDRCPSCRGVWLDPGEYDAVRVRLRSPGVRPSKTTPRDDFVGDVAVELLDVMYLLAEIVF
jgi:Zn-finger nucleic acid-binding protein